MTRSLMFALAIAVAPNGELWSQESCWAGTGDTIGPRGGDRVIERSFNGLGVCAIGRGLSYATHLPPSEWGAVAPLVILETRLEGTVLRLRITKEGAALERNSAARAIDGAAIVWRSALFDVLGGAWQLDRLRQDTSKYIGLAPTGDQRGSGQSMVASVPGELIAIRSELEGLKGEWHRAHREIGALRTEVSRLQADIRSEQNSIAQLQSQLSSADARDRARINRDIQRGYQEVGRIESALRRADANLRARETQLATLDLAPKIEKLDRQLRMRAGAPTGDTAEAPKNVDVAGRLATLDLMVDAERARNERELEAAIDRDLQRLRAAINALTSP